MDSSTYLNQSYGDIKSFNQVEHDTMLVNVLIFFLVFIGKAMEELYGRLFIRKSFYSFTGVEM